MDLWLMNKWIKRCDTSRRLSGTSEKRQKDDILASYICSIAHELTHYYQWLNGVELTPIGEERQASRYASLILKKYAETREHP